MGKNSYALNFTEPQLDKLIKITEGDITIQLSDLNNNLPQLREAEIMYNDIKNECDAIESKLNENKSLLEALIRYRDNTDINKEIRILRTTSATDKPAKKTREFKWIPLAVKILEESNRFMLPGAIYESILAKNEYISNKIKSKPNEAAFRIRVSQNFLRAADPNIPRKRGERLIISYKGKIGLYDWVIDDVPLPKYMKEFVHKK